MSQETTKKNGSIYQTGFMTAAVFAAVSLLGLIYRMILMRILGSRGMGYYAMASELYQLLVLFIAGGIPLAISMITSECAQKRAYRENITILKNIRIYESIISILFAGLLFAGAGQIGQWLYGTGEADWALRFFAPSLFIMALLNVYDGFFKGLKSMVPTMISQIAGQMICMLFGLIAAAVLINKGFAFGAAGAALGSLAGALSSLIFYMVLYHAFKPKILKRVAHQKNTERITFGKSVRMTLGLMIPYVLCQLVYQADGILDAVLFNRLLMGIGYTESVRVEMFGVYSGQFRTVILLPVVFASAVAAILMPSVRQAYKIHHTKWLNDQSHLIIRMSMVLSIWCAALLSVLSKPVVRLLFSDISELPSALIMVGAPAAVFSALSAVTGMILQNIRRRKAAAVNFMMALVIHGAAVVALLLVSNMNIVALVYGCYVFAFAAAFLNIRTLRKTSGYRQEYLHTFVLPVFAALILAGIGWLIYHGVTFLIHSVLFGIIVTLVVSAAVYMISIIILGVFSEQEILKFPLGRDIVSLCKKIHIL